jgi:hypothetical protein
MSHAMCMFGFFSLFQIKPSFKMIVPTQVIHVVSYGIADEMNMFSNVIMQWNTDI